MSAEGLALVITAIGAVILKTLEWRRVGAVAELAAKAVREAEENKRLTALALLDKEAATTLAKKLLVEKEREKSQSEAEKWLNTLNSLDAP